MSEFTVFITVKIPNLKAISKSRLEIVSRSDIKDNEIINIIIAKKYLLISLIFTLILFRDNLLE